jgi:protein-arginine kinase activator protein McsA
VSTKRQQYCVICRFKPATRVVLAMNDGNRWSRYMCDSCETPAGSIIVSNKGITFNN